MVPTWPTAEARIRARSGSGGSGTTERETVFHGEGDGAERSVGCFRGEPYGRDGRFLSRTCAQAAGRIRIAHADRALRAVVTFMQAHHEPWRVRVPAEAVVVDAEGVAPAPDMRRAAILVGDFRRPDRRAGGEDPEHAILGAVVVDPPRPSRAGRAADPSP